MTLVTWHLMFHEPEFTRKQIQALVAQLNANDEFGGFPIKSQFGTATSQFIAVDCQLQVVNAIDHLTLEQMLKFLLIMANQLEQAPPALYYGVMALTIEQLGIEWHPLNKQAIDVIYWQNIPSH